MYYCNRKITTLQTVFYLSTQNSMQDLINEEEFLTKVHNYNYWKYFGICYAVAISSLLLFTGLLVLANLLLPVYVMVLSILLFVFPLLVIPVMIFKNKKLKQVPLPKVMLPVSILFSVFYIPLCTMSGIGNDDYMNAVLAYFIIMLVTMPILLFVFWIRHRRYVKHFSGKFKPQSSSL